ncbi:MAG TPA: galactose-1-phosphate uridylyltransferase [Streptosporangiaceae bacterium]
MKRTVGHLADGREIIYFDDSDDADRDRPDPRTLPEPPAASELRHDPLLREWVAVAAHRQGRTFLPPADECPLCPSTPERATEIPAYDYQVAVFENRFPSFSHRGGRGRCEVVCFTSDHNASFASLPPAQVRVVMEAWVDRTAELSTLPGVQQVFPFENRGEEIGVTLHHAHGQIYGYPFVPPVTSRMLAAAADHHARTGGDLFAEILGAERAAGTRVVGANDHWTAFVPEAARWPFEIHLYPHRHVPDLPALTAAERAAFGPLYLDVLRRLDGVYGLSMPYISGWFQAPVAAHAPAGRDLFRLHLRLFSIRRAPGKLKYLAGSESAMGAFINDIRPEDAARMLREAAPGRAG